jgi:hypothetical protein
MSKLARGDEPRVNPFQIMLKIQMSDRFLEFGIIEGVAISTNIWSRRVES